jgi:hypothetical protein
LTHKAIPVAVDGANFGQTILAHIKGSYVYEEEKLPSLKKFFRSA